MSGDRPSRADDSSRVTRRRAASAPAYEVDLEDLELVDDPPSARRSGPTSTPVRLASAPPRASLPPPPRAPRVALMPPTPPRRPSMTRIHTVAPSSSSFPASAPPPPVELDALPRRAPFHVPLTAMIPRRRRSVATVVVAAVAAFFVVAGAITSPRAPQDAAPPVNASPVPVPPAHVDSTPAPPAPAPAAPQAPAASEGARSDIPSIDVSQLPQHAVPSVDVSTLPRAHEGTVVGAQGHRLWIDGVLATSWQATVKCGSHTVQVGSAGAARTVDVPCGQEVKVQP